MKKIALGFLITGMIILIGFLFILYNNGYCINKSIDMTVTGQIGDFIGGVVGTVWSLSGILFIYATIQQQNIIIERDNDKFLFELLQKKYVNEINGAYSNIYNDNFENNYSQVYNYIKFEKSIYHKIVHDKIIEIVTNILKLKNMMLVWHWLIRLYYMTKKGG